MERPFNKKSFDFQGQTNLPNIIFQARRMPYPQDPWDWYMYLHFPQKSTTCRYRYTSPMDAMPYATRGYNTNDTFFAVQITLASRGPCAEVGGPHLEHVQIMALIDMPKRQALMNPRWWQLKDFFFHPDPWGRFPIGLIFFKGVETTNQNRT